MQWRRRRLVHNPMVDVGGNRWIQPRFLSLLSSPNEGLSLLPVVLLRRSMGHDKLIKYRRAKIDVHCNMYSRE